MPSSGSSNPETPRSRSSSRSRSLVRNADLESRRTADIRRSWRSRLRYCSATMNRIGCSASCRTGRAPIRAGRNRRGHRLAYRRLELDVGALDHPNRGQLYAAGRVYDELHPYSTREADSSPAPAIALPSAWTVRFKCFLKAGTRGGHSRPNFQHRTQRRPPPSDRTPGDSA